MTDPLNETALQHVRQASDEELRAHFDNRFGATAGGRVLFLDRGQSTTAVSTQEPGRYGYLQNGSRGHRALWECKSAGSYAYGYHDRLAILNPRVATGDQVIVVQSSADMYTSANGWRAAVVSQDGDNRIRVRFENGNYHYAAKWVLAASTEAAAAPTSEQPQEAPRELVQHDETYLSQWWIDRINDIAARAKRQHGFCSEINSTVAELLEPTKRYRAITNATLGGYDIKAPDNSTVAWFASTAEATEYLRQKNKKQES